MMRFINYRSIAIILFLVLLPCRMAWGQEYIQEIEIEGSVRIEEETVLLQVSSEVGETLEPRTVEKDIKKIYRTGFFEQVTAHQRAVEKGVVLVFAVTEKPAIRKILIEGNEEVSDDTFEEKLNIGGRLFLDRRKIALGIEEVKSYYQTQGYYGVEIDYEVTPVKEKQVDLTFNVTESKKKVIREVVFEGNRAFDDDDLSDLVETSKYRWWSSWATGSGKVEEAKLEQDVQSITRFYLTKGHIDVRVTKPVVEEMEDGLRVRFKVSEGDVFNYGSISASGTLLEDSSELTLEGVGSKEGDVFNVETLRKDSFVISSKFTDIGYAFANVDPTTQIDREAKRIDVNFVIDQGELIRIDRVVLSGNEKTRDNVIRRSLKIQERELFSSSKIARSQELLQRLGYFDEVTITPEPSVRENEVDLNIAVREGNTGSFSAGAGISSGDGFITTGRITESNLFGTGNSLSLNANLGSRRENIVLSFNNPRVNDSQWSFGTDLLSTQYEFDDFDRKQMGGSVTVGYPLWFLGPEYLDDIRFSLGYELLHVDISDVNLTAPRLIKDQEGKTVSSSVIPRLVRNTIDNPLSPTRGSRQLLRTEIAGLGGDQEFWLAQFSNSWYYPIWQPSFGTFVFSQRTRFGWGETFNGEDFPLFRRFFPGGINSVRGYEARELGPQDALGNPYGGSKQLITNFEIIFPLINALGFNGVVFYDAGEAFDDDESIELDELRLAWGWGIRWKSPIAPIRVEFGYPIDKERGDKSVVTHFSFGSPL